MFRKNHVGRPSNEELKRRRTKKMLMISIPICLVIVLIILIMSGKLSNLMGNSVTKIHYYCEDNTYKLAGTNCYKTIYINSLLFGDVDGNNKVNIQDVTAIKGYVAKYIELDDNQKLASDVNQDGVVNDEDASIIQKYLIGIVDDNKNAQKNSTNGLDSAYTIGKDRLCPKGYNINKTKTKCSKTINKTALKTEILYGDLNNDKKVDIEDANILNNYLLGKIELDNIQKIAADYNKDNVINIDDLNEINKLIESSIEASVTQISNVDTKSVLKNTKVSFKAQFNIKGNKKYYFKWYDIKSTNNNVSTECKLVNNSDTYSINVTDDNEYVLLKIYDDEKCNNEIKKYKTDSFKLKEESSISLDVKLVSPILTSNTVNKNTVLKYIVNPTIKGNDKYYYTFTYYGDNKLVNKPVCKDITNNNSISSTFTVDKKDMYGVWSVYKDSSCSKNSIIKRLETDKYNYLVDSINLKLNNNKLSVGDSVKIDATIKSDYKVDNNSIKWDSTNTSVATVSKDGLVTAKKAGKTNIVATAGGVSASKEIIVVENETDIKCPLIEYQDNGNLFSFTITPDASISSYEVYLSTNDNVGDKANFKLISKSSGVKTFKNLYNNQYSNQGKIVVYNKNGNSRNCYTANLFKIKSSTSTSAKCPKIDYSFDDIKNVNKNNYSSNNRRVNSGYSKMYVFYNQKKEFQYSWYTSNKDGTYKLFKTYATSNKNVKPSVTAQIYDRNGIIVVTDKYGNSVTCRTEYVNKINYNKTKVGTTDIYYESTYPISDKNAVINQMNKLKNENEIYLAASNVFLNKYNP